MTYESGGVTFCRAYFASRPADVIVVRLTASRPGAVSGEITPGNLHEIPIVSEDNALVIRGDTSGFFYWRLMLESRDRLIASRAYASERNIDLDFEARLRVVHDGGRLVSENNAIRFEGCNSITILFAADTNYLADRTRGWRGEHPRDRVTARVDQAAKRSYEHLLTEHIADHQSRFSRLAIDIGESPERLCTLPTAERVATYSEHVNAKRSPEDRELEALLYQYARYLLIASSSPGPGTLPANLQGIWNINRRPSWRCDFHTDVNIQMNYWFADSSNLADCFEPLAHWVESIREVRKEETRRVFGIEHGWLMRSENGIFGGSTWHIQKGDSAWLCQNLWDHHAFTQDKAYLGRYAYPVMKEISEFWIDHLKELPDGNVGHPEQTGHHDVRVAVQGGASVVGSVGHRNRLATTDTRPFQHALSTIGRLKLEAGTSPTITLAADRLDSTATHGLRLVSVELKSVCD